MGARDDDDDSGEISLVRVGDAPARNFHVLPVRVIRLAVAGDRADDAVR